MSRVIFDVSAMSASWFKKNREELISCKDVRGVYTEHDKYAREVKVNRPLLQIFAELAKGRRLDIVPPENVEEKIQYLEGLAIWQSTSACDDPHIFAMHRCKPVTHVFTNDRRIGTCRDCLRNRIEKEFSKFSLVASEANYKQHRSKIMRE